MTGLTSLLSGALEEKGKSPLLDRGTVLVLTAAAIALGATSMSDVALLRHLTPLWAAGPAAQPPAAPWSGQGQSGPWTGSPAHPDKDGAAPTWKKGCWAITEADEAAITAFPADAWKPGIRQDGSIE